MKRTALLLLWACLLLCIRGYSQTISYTGRNIPLEKIFTEIEKQTGYVVVYNYEVIKNAKAVSVDVKKTPLEEFLKLVLEGQGLVFRVSKGNVVISRRGEERVAEDVKPTDLTGRVVNEKDEPIVGATVAVKNGNMNVATDPDGYFTLKSMESNTALIITSIGYEPKTIKLNGESKITIQLIVSVQEMKQVSVVSTGYQQLPKERVTGSFTQVGQELLDRKVSTNILDRLDGIANGVLFDKRNPNATNIQIRGLSTLSSEMAQPLIIVDNFPYSGDISNINPNNVESITILKDAAAASIWGAKAGNGVIVITTFKGNFNQSLKVTANANVTVMNRPDLFDLPQLSSPAYIDVEKFVFTKGGYNFEINNRFKPPLSNAVEILLNLRNGLINQAQADEQLNALKQFDVRNDFHKYIYRKSVNQQYSINLSGGSSNTKYFHSFGFDRNLRNLIGNEYNRFNLHSDNTINIIKKLQVRFTIDYTLTQTNNNSLGDYFSRSYKLKNRLLSPYARLIDERGNSLPLETMYRKTFTDTAGRGLLQDWKFRPLDELAINDNTDHVHNFLGNFGINYKLLKELSVEAMYQYERSFGTDQKNHEEQSFYARDLVNQFSQINGSEVKYMIPKGGILDLINNNIEAHAVRGQINFNRTYNNTHQITAIGGAEVRQVRTFSNYTRSYGYNERLNVSNVDYVSVFPTYGNIGGSQLIPNLNGFENKLTRMVSIYANASYMLKSKYAFSASVRNDRSNLFGVNSNQKGVPLWSIGGSWKLSNEDFYNISCLPVLNFRATYGTSGNINNSATALTTISYNPAIFQVTNIPFANIANSPNPDLKWEKVKQANFGVNFSISDNKLSGSIEYYVKKSTDVFGQEQLDLTTGIASILNNSAHIRGTGLDFQVSQKFINNTDFRWESSFFLSYANYKVTKYLLKINTDNGYTSEGSAIIPLEGYNPYLVVSYKWGGLDPQTGNPIGYLNGKASMNYDSLAYNSPLRNQVIHGSAVPTVFGSILNTFTYRNFSISTNITYRLGYYFRRSTISYGALYRGQTMHSDYNLRWQKSGDEQHTSIPSMIYPALDSRDQFYTKSEITVEKGDHFRMEDIRLAYSLSRKNWRKIPFNQVQFYGYLSNLNILLWRANNRNIDPDNPLALRPPMSIAAGLRIEF